MGTTIGLIKGDTRSLDYSSCRPPPFQPEAKFVGLGLGLGFRECWVDRFRV